MDYQFNDNEDLKWFELHLNDAIAFIDYIVAQETIYLTHTEVPKGYEGQGIGFIIVKRALNDIKSKGLKLVPLCPFVAMYLKKNPEWKELVYRNINHHCSN
ncbi:hypothetical protein BST97_14100 [Nonlabens spongiae]|uniref:N-acetyltransferase domain-containing protein n=1 Tax=Nonlabens spongiae TaxID=331648 RepID=A0A1W6MNH3_9FLAO|nr:GNAT family N-acetyltransferase [Nonlabens spongiae]ARN79029.1 hypothetical protein BST97_14100 [Nonlabens spongiae]